MPEPDDTAAPLDAGAQAVTAVSLSGGGYRAMLFHLGFLWRLRDAGILGTIDRFASVSGGSIVAGMLAPASASWSPIRSSRCRSNRSTSPPG